jgi:hypothetical protein
MTTLRTILMVLLGFAVIPALVTACAGEPDETGTEETGM